MASGKGHFAGGFIFFIIILHTISNYFYRPTPFDIIIYCILCLMFALWPDVDIKSKGQKLFYRIFFVVDIFFIYLEEYKIAAYFGLIIILPILSKHRGWTHSIPAMFLIPSPILLYPIYLSNSYDFSGMPYYVSAVTGYFSHLLLDKKIIIFK